MQEVNVFRIQMKLIVFVSLIVAVMAGHSSNNGGYGNNKQPSGNSPRNAPICPTGGEPVCATDGKQYISFGNKCHLDAHNYKQLFAGKPSLLQTDTSNCFSNCSQIVCLAIYEPVCAIQNNTYITKTFSNKCQVNVEICLTETQWTVIYKGPCVQDRKCPQTCTTEYKPVCAAYNNQERTFSNECELVRLILQEKQDWKIVRDGPCDLGQCPAIYDPICASLYGIQQTFTSRCVLENEIRNTGNAWQILFEGECQFVSSNNGQGPVAAAGAYGQVLNPSQKPTTATAALPAQSQYKNGPVLNPGTQSGTGSTAINDYGKAPYSNQQPPAPAPPTGTALIPAPDQIPCGPYQHSGNPISHSGPTLVAQPNQYGNGLNPNPGPQTGADIPTTNDYRQKPAVPATYGPAAPASGTGSGAATTNGYGQQPTIVQAYRSSQQPSVPPAGPASISQPGQPQYGSGSVPYADSQASAGSPTTNDYRQQPAAPVLPAGPAPGHTQYRNGPSGTSVTNGYGQSADLSNPGKNSLSSTLQPAAAVPYTGPTPTSAVAQSQYRNGPVSNPATYSGNPSGNTSPALNHWWWCRQESASNLQPSGSVGVPSSYTSTGLPSDASASAINGYGQLPAHIGQPRYQNGPISNSGAQASAGGRATNAHGLQPAAVAPYSGTAPISAPGHPKYGSSSGLNPVFPSGTGPAASNAYGQQPAAVAPYSGTAPISAPGHPKYGSGSGLSPGLPSGAGSAASNAYGQQPAAVAPYSGTAPISAPGHPKYGSGSGLNPGLPSGTGQAASNAYGQQPAAVAPYSGTAPISAPGHPKYGSSSGLNPGLPSGTGPAASNAYGQQPVAVAPYSGTAPISAPGHPKYGSGSGLNPGLPSGAGSAASNAYGQQPVAVAPYSGTAPISAPGHPKYGSGSGLNPGLTSGTGQAARNAYGQQPAAVAPYSGTAHISAPGHPKYRIGSGLNPGLPSGVGSAASNAYGQQPVAVAPYSGTAPIPAPGHPKYGSGSGLNPGLPSGAGSAASNAYGQQPAVLAPYSGTAPISAPGQHQYGSGPAPNPSSSSGTYSATGPGTISPAVNKWWWHEQDSASNAQPSTSIGPAGSYANATPGQTQYSKTGLSSGSSASPSDSYGQAPSTGPAIISSPNQYRSGPVQSRGYEQQPSVAAPSTGHAPISTQATYSNQQPGPAPGRPHYGSGSAPNPGLPSGSGAFATNSYGQQLAASAPSAGSAPISAPGQIPCGPGQSDQTQYGNGPSQGLPSVGGASPANSYGQVPYSNQQSGTPASPVGPASISTSSQPQYKSVPVLKAAPSTDASASTSNGYDQVPAIPASSTGPAPISPTAQSVPCAQQGDSNKQHPASGKVPTADRTQYPNKQDQPLFAQPAAPTLPAFYSTAEPTISYNQYPFPLAYPALFPCPVVEPEGTYALSANSPQLEYILEKLTHLKAYESGQKK